ncbi:adenylate kinase [Cystoisospora suis]|uniref:Adenylate kinase n=1 Tax=Cystoisospora suis TaxID=483139 RepID=A0A2C6L5L7_9APIC|nr:adenylate kinase [Cystoisospora suis]
MSILTQPIRPLVLRLIFIGAPGTGKGTYASRLAKSWGIAHVSTGDLIREEINRNSDLGNSLRQRSVKGELVPDDVVVAICKDKLLRKECEKGWILDGFPRTLSQAVQLQVICPPTLCVHLFLPDNILVTKLLARRICRTCGGNFNVANIHSPPYELPPLLPPSDCQTCHGDPEFLNRADDTETVVKNRLAIFARESEPLLRFYKEQGVLLNFHVKKGLKDLPDLSAQILSRASGQELCTDLS